MNVVEDVCSYLEGLGLAGGASGWVARRGYDAQDPAQCIVVIETAGEQPDTANRIERPRFQVTVRGTAWSYNPTSAQCRLVYEALHTATIPIVGNVGAEYAVMTALQTPFFLDYDELDRPSFLFNVRCVVTE